MGYHEELHAMTCGNCQHDKANHVNIDGTPNSICNATIYCNCECYMESNLVEFAEEIEKLKSELKFVKHRVRWILEKIPQTRNAGDKSFPKIYFEIWHGVKLRKAPVTISINQWNDLPSSDDINRMKRHVKQYNPELRTYDPDMLKHQIAKYQAVLEFVTIDG